MPALDASARIAAVSAWMPCAAADAAGVGAVRRPTDADPPPATTWARADA